MGIASSLKVVLILPSNYDDDGYVVRYWRGVFPSNTLACMRSLTLGFSERWKREKCIDITVETYDDHIEKIPYHKIARANRGGTKVVAALVGVQSNQFPRASDIAKKLTASGVKTLIGGFHVSGVLTMFDEPTAEIREPMDCGVTVVQGEAENVWESIIADVVAGKEQQLYRMNGFPDITDTPVPQPDAHSKRKIAVSCMGTIDCSRGCPFNCSFCTIINVQGHKMRHRSADAVLKTIRDAYANGIKQYFFTDDNFSRNPEWEGVFDGLIRMRENEGIKIGFIMQVDTACDKIEGFVEKAAAAGCSTAFIGMESINSDNLKAAGKTQNKVDHYADYIETWHQAGVMCHVGYIIGFPFDTPESVRHDIERLKTEVRPDLASFFVLTPLPGSKDHYNLVKSGAKLDPDLNKYDSFHTVAEHPLMSGDELLQAYQDAWDSFYDLDNLKSILKRARGYNCWRTAAFCLMWYKNSMLEPRHPMVTGFIRRKDRTDARPGTAVPGALAFKILRLREFAVGVRKRVDLFFELQELWWLTSRPDDRTFTLLADFTSALDDAKTKIASFDLNVSYAKWCEEASAVKASLLEKINAFSNASPLKGKSRRRMNNLIDEMSATLEKTNIGDYYNRGIFAFNSYLSKNANLAEEFILKSVRQRRSMTRFWGLTWNRIKRGKIISLFISLPRIAFSAIRDFRMSLWFAYRFFIKNT